MQNKIDMGIEDSKIQELVDDAFRSTNKELPASNSDDVEAYNIIFSALRETPSVTISSEFNNQVIKKTRLSASIVDYKAILLFFSMLLTMFFIYFKWKSTYPEYSILFSLRNYSLIFPLVLLCFSIAYYIDISVAKKKH